MPDADQQPRRYQYHAELGPNALPEMLYTVYLHRVPGVIECNQGDVLKRVFLRDGAVIHASSTDRQDSLGVFLHRTGRISAEQFAFTDKLRANSPDKRHVGMLLGGYVIDSSSKRATWANRRGAKFPRSSRLTTRRTLRLNAAVTPSASS